jgi:hypothetical protein
LSKYLSGGRHYTGKDITPTWNYGKDTEIEMPVSSHSNPVRKNSKCSTDSDPLDRLINIFKEDIDKLVDSQISENIRIRREAMQKLADMYSRDIKF